jgi:hypothetical protein
LPQAQSLYGIERASDKDSSESYPDYLDLRDRNHSFVLSSLHHIMLIRQRRKPNTSFA